MRCAPVDRAPAIDPYPPAEGQTERSSVWIYPPRFRPTSPAPRPLKWSATRRPTRPEARRTWKYAAAPSSPRLLRWNLDLPAGEFFGCLFDQLLRVGIN